MKFNTILLMNPLRGHWSTQSREHPPITTGSRIHIDGLITSTWCFRLRMDFDVEILSPIFSSKMEVGTAAQHVIQVNRFGTHQCHHPCKYKSYVTLFHWIHSSLLLTFLHGKSLPLDRLVESCQTSRFELWASPI